MLKHIRSILNGKSGRKVESIDVEFPATAKAWVEVSGYDEPALMQFAWEGWIVKEGAPEVRQYLAKGEVSKAKAKKILEARVKNGWRERKASPKEQKLREAGATEQEIETWKRMQALTK